MDEQKEAPSGNIVFGYFSTNEMDRDHTVFAPGVLEKAIKSRTKDIAEKASIEAHVAARGGVVRLASRSLKLWNSDDLIIHLSQQERRYPRELSTTEDFVLQFMPEFEIREQITSRFRSLPSYDHMTRTAKVCEIIPVLYAIGKDTVHPLPEGFYE